MIFFGCSDRICAERAESNLYFPSVQEYASTSQVQFPCISPPPEISAIALLAPSSTKKTSACRTDAPSRNTAGRAEPPFDSIAIQFNFLFEKETTPYELVYAP